MEASIENLGRRAQVEDLGANDLLVLQDLIRTNMPMLQDDLHSLNKEITELRTAIEVQTQVMEQKNHDDSICGWKEWLRRDSQARDSVIKPKVI